VKETYIYKELEKISERSNNEKELLKLISKWIYNEFNIKTCFCEIIGKRWSFITVINELIITDYSSKITDNLGIITENISVKPDVWQEIISSLKQLLNQSWGQTP
jgi:hypothetical protein